MRVAVLGANGQLGSDLVRAFRRAGHPVVELTHDQVRVEERASLRDALTQARPDALLNTAAFHHLPRCEEQPERAFAVNAQGALNAARVAADLGAMNVYFSTDYVFDGEKGQPYLETDRPNPLNVYAASKLAGEHLTLAYAPRSFVVRISGIYGRTPCRAKGESFVRKMARLARERPEVRVVVDEVLTPTPTAEIAARLPALLASGAFGLYHLTCEGSCSWHDFAREIFALLELDTPLLPATAADFPTPFRRPSYSVLENGRLKALAAEGGQIQPMPHWRDALRRFLADAEP